MNRLISHVADIDQLYCAWREVRSQVRRTKWAHLLEELSEFEASPLRRLRKIQQDIVGGTYQFSPKRAYAKRKSGGSRRGVTVLALGDRVVQRSILNIMFCEEPTLKAELGVIPDVLHTPTSFAGVLGKGVPEAIEMAANAIRSGATAFAYSDMKDFFPCVPRQDVVKWLRENIRDEAFLKLFSDALETEIENQAELREWISLFPITEVGVAQGSLLSTLVGNLCLKDFDACLNRDSMITIRYLDDFLILTNDLPRAKAGFERAKQELSKLGMACYEPGDGSNKSAIGLVKEGFNFLGCHVHPDGISPARSACKKLLHDLAMMISHAKKHIATFQDGKLRRRADATYLQTLNLIDRKIRGWGDVYRFVSNRLPFAQMDQRIQKMLDDFDRWYRQVACSSDARGRRRMMGIALLSDTLPRESSG